MCSKFDDYKLIKEFETGVVYKNWIRISMDNFESEVETDDIEIEVGDI